MEKEFIYNQWTKRRLFALEKDKLKAKKYIYTSYLDASKPIIFASLSRKIFIFDSSARFLRNKGFNVLQGFGYSDLNYNYLKDSKLSKMQKCFDEKNIAPLQKMIEEFGVGYDYNKKIKTNSYDYIKFVQQVFCLLYNNKLISYEKVNYLFSAVDNKIYNIFESQFYNIKNSTSMFNHELCLNISKYISRIIIQIQRLDMEDVYKKILLDAFEEYSVMEFKLESFTGNINLQVDIEEPQYLSGINFICLNPNKIDVFKYVDSEERDCVRSYISNPKRNGVFSGIFIRNPLDNRQIPLIISYQFDDDIHIGIPSINPVDYEFAVSLDLDITNILEEGILINSDFITSMTPSEAKETITKAFVQEDIATFKANYRLQKIVISELDLFGVLIPITKDENTNKLSLVDKNIPAYLSANYKKVYKEDDIVVEENELIDGSLNHLFVRGLSNIFIKYYDLKFNFDFPFECYENIEEVSNLIISKTEIFSEILMPIIFNEIFKDILNVDYLGQIKKVMVINDANLVDLDVTNSTLLCELNNNYSSDAVRLYLLNNSFNEEFNFVESSIMIYQTYLNNINKIYNHEFERESLIKDSFIRLKQIVNNYMNSFDYDKAISLLITYYQEVLINKKMTKQEALEYLVMLSVFAPYFAEIIYNKIFDSSGFVVYEPWPLT